MLLTILLSIPIIGMFFICTRISYNFLDLSPIKQIKLTSLNASIVSLFISFILFISFDNSSNQFQFVQQYDQISPFDFYLGLDGLSLFFMLLTTIIIPISLLSNWTSISKNIRPHVITILLLDMLLLVVFLVLDILLYYIFFESILPPLFIVIGLYGSSDRVRASYYLFLYTLFGSLFLLLSIVTMSSIMGTTDYDTLFKSNYEYFTQFFLFYGIFIAFAVKTPTIFLNTWLLKAHVESPLSGSIILAALVLKLSLYGIFRLIIPLLPKAFLDYTYIVYLIGVITILYASISTLRTIDIKELIAYSSVSHAAVYLLGVFSNTIQGIEGGITLGLAHGFVSSGLFICAGGVLYDRCITRLITYYRGIAQLMPLFSILFFILCLANAGTPFTLNFIGEFLSLFGTFERLPLLGAFASSSIVFSAAYTIYMFNRIAFAGAFSKYFLFNILDVNKREFFILLTLVVFTVVLGVYPAPILDGLHYTVSCMINKSPDLYLIFCLSFWKFNKKTNMKIKKKIEKIKLLPRNSTISSNIFVSIYKKFTFKTLFIIVLNAIFAMTCRYIILKYWDVNVLTDFDLNLNILNIITYIYGIVQGLFTYLIRELVNRHYINVNSIRELIDLWYNGNKVKIGGPNVTELFNKNETIPNVTKLFKKNETIPKTIEPRPYVGPSSTPFDRQTQSAIQPENGGNLAPISPETSRFLAWTEGIRRTHGINGDTVSPLGQSGAVVLDSRSRVKCFFIRDTNGQLDTGYNNNQTNQTNQPLLKNFGLSLEELKRKHNLKDIGNGIVNSKHKRFLLGFINDNPSIPTNKRNDIINNSIYQSNSDLIINALKNAR